MSKIVIFGNSGSGKSTLAKSISDQNDIPHLDLDTIAWQNTSPPTRVSLTESKSIINEFIGSNQSWVIEGCYADLLSQVINYACEIYFLNLPIDDCIINAKNRPWESHKYKSKAAQDENLNMLIQWISEYPTRDDCLSQSAHNELYNDFNGKKIMLTSNAGYSELR